MMYGTVETDEERLEHMLRLRELQDETGGFTAFITWSYQPEHTERGGREATGIEYLRTLAIARLVLDNFDNLQASWVTQGGKVGQLSLAFGANDMGSVMIEENVVRAAGAVVLHGRSRDRPQRRGRRLRRQAPQHALRHPRRSVLPRPRRPAHARIVDGARRGRHLRARRARELSRAQRRRQEAAIAGARPRRSHDRVPRGVGLPIDRAPIKDGSSRSTAGGSPRSGTGNRGSGTAGVAISATSRCLPGLVNAHTHLELSWLRGRVPPAARFTDWVKTLFAIRGRPGPGHVGGADRADS